MIATRRQGGPSSVRPAVPASGIRTGYRDYAGVRTRVLEAGPAAGASTAPRLVLLHGYCDSADTWRDVLARLAAAGRSAVAVDLPGSGAAEPLRPGAMLPQLDDFVEAVLQREAVAGPRPRARRAARSASTSPHGGAVLVGNSLGGTVSLRAAQNPALPVSGVVSIAAPGFADSWLTRIVAGSPVPLRLWSSIPLAVPAPVVRAVAAYLVPRLLYADATAAEARHVQRFTDLFPDHRSTLAKWEEACRLVAELARAYELDRLRAPLLVVACGRDRLVSASSGSRVRSLVPHSRLLFRPDWGHCPQLDDPAAVADVLVSFAETTLRRRSGALSPVSAKATVPESPAPEATDTGTAATAITETTVLGA